MDYEEIRNMTNEEVISALVDVYKNTSKWLLDKGFNMVMRSFNGDRVQEINLIATRDFVFLRLATDGRLYNIIQRN